MVMLSLFHAFKAAQVQESIPIIIELKIPDEDKIVMDYDVAIELYGKGDDETIRLGYADAKKYGTETGTMDDVKKRMGDKKVNISKQLGVFGYKGRIPASFFTKIIIDDEALVEYIQYEEIGGDLDGIEYDDVSRWEDYTREELSERVKEIRQEMEDDFEQMDEE